MKKIKTNKAYYLKNQNLMQTSCPVGEKAIVGGVDGRGIVHGHYPDFKTSMYPCTFMVADFQFFKIFSEKPKPE